MKIARNYGPWSQCWSYYSLTIFFSKNVDHEAINIMLNHYVFWEKKNTDLSSWRYYRCPNAPMIAVGGKGGNSESHSGRHGSPLFSGNK